jgi:WD40 repeat protein
MHFDPLSQSVVNNEFKFGQVLNVHQGAVRCLCVLPGVDSLVSGSIDSSCKLFNLDKSNGRYSFEREFTYHDSFVLAVHPE